MTEGRVCDVESRCRWYIVESCALNFCCLILILPLT
jgi:hypothetical protein